MRVAVVLAATFGVATAAFASAGGTWTRLPRAPIAPGPGAVSVWTGRQMIVFGRAHPNSNEPWSADVAAAYDPSAGTWRKLTPFPGDKGNYEGHYSAIWTGMKVLVFGPADGQAFDPRTNTWRRLPRSLPPEFALGLVVWTGHEAIAWGGGCCGDASNSGSAYNPTTGKVRKLARSPLAPTQQPMGAWAGRELILFVSGLDPDGKPYPASFARAAAYNPKTNTWRRIAPMPGLREQAVAVWDGSEVLLVGGSAGSRVERPRLPRTGYAYEPATNRWQRIAPMASGREGFAAVWTGKQLFVWAGKTTVGGPPQYPPRGVAYDPTSNRWSTLPRAPLVGRTFPASVWTGRAMIVWGGTSAGYRALDDGAALIPATP